VRITLAELFGGRGRKTDGYSRGLQAARVRAAYQRAYFAPALFNLIPVETDLIASMAVDEDWRLYYNPAWITGHTVEENSAVLLHEVGHLLRDHAARKKAAGADDDRRWNTAGDCEINDDLHAEGLVLPGDPPLPDTFGLQAGQSAEIYYHQLPASPRAKDVSRGADDEKRPPRDCGSGAHGERRGWELPPDDAASGGVGGVDRVKAEMVRREVAQRIMELARDRGDIPFGWRRWAHEKLTPKVDYMATIRHVVRRALRDSTVGRYDRTYRRPHRRQACYGEFIMPSFYQPRPRPGFLIDTSGSMDNAQLARALAELGGLTRQLGYGADVVVSCCDAAVHSVKKVFTAAQVELFGGGGTDMVAGLQSFVDRTAAPIDVLIIVTDCLTPWPEAAPPFPVITIRVGEGTPPAWGTRGSNKMITLIEPQAYREDTLADRMRRWRRGEL
jgi:predicted metal-dependent peptidase